MKNRLTFPLLLFISITIFCLQSKNYFVQSYGPLDQNYKPTPALLNLLNFLQVQHDGSLESIVKATQQAWLRPKDKERWEIAERYENKREELLNHFSLVGIVDNIKPTNKHYDYVILLGCTAPTFRKRIAHLVKLFNAGTSFDKIVLLGSQRSLDSNLESVEELLDAHNKWLSFKPDWQQPASMPTTEIEMMKMIIDQTKLPSELSIVPFIFVDTPMQIAGDGTIRRATTADTIAQWLSASPKPGSCILISSQPYVGYQDAVARTNLPLSFTVDTVGLEAGMKEKIVTYLDSLARWLYQENALCGQHKGY